jgi:lipoprotein-anchoring transpeptidase ErfK/SrfK
MVAAAITRSLTRLAPSLPLAVLLAACATTTPKPLAGPTRNQIIISVRDQKLTVVTEDHRRVTFPISTSKFGLGDRRGSLATPTGELEVAQKVGDGAAPGTVFHGRVRTGEIVKVDQPGRDAIVTRILALKGLEATNKEAYSRGIYIHGTPEERNIGRPVSYGCIRMRSKDVIQLYDMVKVGARVEIIDQTMNQAIASNIVLPAQTPAGAATPAAGNVKVSAGMNIASGPAANAPSIKPAAAGVSAVAPGTTAAAPQVAAEASASKAPAKKTVPPAKKEWAGAAAKLLAKQAAIEAKAKNAKPIGAPRPVSNEDDNSRQLNRNALDSL